MSNEDQPDDQLPVEAVQLGANTVRMTSPDGVAEPATARLEEAARKLCTTTCQSPNQKQQLEECDIICLFGFFAGQVGRENYPEHRQPLVRLVWKLQNSSELQLSLFNIWVIWVWACFAYPGTPISLWPMFLCLLEKIDCSECRERDLQDFFLPDVGTWKPFLDECKRKNLEVVPTQEHSEDWHKLVMGEQEASKDAWGYVSAI